MGGRKTKANTLSTNARMKNMPAASLPVLPLKIGFINFLFQTITNIKTSKMRSLEKDCQGDKCMASPKHPQSVTLLK